MAESGAADLLAIGIAIVAEAEAADMLEAKCKCGGSWRKTL